MNEKILFVDDEPHVLASIKRSLRKQFCVDTAQSGPEALEALDQKGPYAIIVSDMQMPEMNGAELLSLAKEKSPHTVRMMLTGNADQQTAIDAINRGDITRFLSKPSSATQIADALQQGLKQYRQVRNSTASFADRLLPFIRLYSEALSLSDPARFQQLSRLQYNCVEMARILKLPNLVEIEIIATLSQLSSVTLPRELAIKRATSLALTEDEEIQIRAQAELTETLIREIPELTQIANAVGNQQQSTPEDQPIESVIIELLIEIDKKIAAGMSAEQALESIHDSSLCCQSKVFAAAQTLFQTSINSLNRPSPIDLSVGSILDQDLFGSDGTLILAKGHTITELTQAWLKRLQTQGQISAS